MKKKYVSSYYLKREPPRVGSFGGAAANRRNETPIKTKRNPPIHPQNPLTRKIALRGGKFGTSPNAPLFRTTQIFRFGVPNQGPKTGHGVGFSEEKFHRENAEIRNQRRWCGISRFPESGGFANGLTDGNAKDFLKSALPAVSII